MIFANLIKKINMNFQLLTFYSCLKTPDYLYYYQFSNFPAPNQSNQEHYSHQFTLIFPIFLLMSSKPQEFQLQYY